ncbi:DUF1905 domain-containing protein [Micropruina glycogenica]|uniref:DUF1905 domain-containing protein n=1 Tax=Micropruina glycogenica TaxID=75385 RepID=A0A2N9JIF3_9ACTN|nr:DUF1905 domain-containing protein [Micropruina glycogenica]SPD87854.1 conserved protein of unknown function [Micropruina glycogenica]
MAEFDFDGVVIEWRGPAPYAYVALPDWVADEVAVLARAVTYGWGMIPVQAQIGDTTWTTSLFPKDGGYLLPIKVAVQRAESIGIGSAVAVTVSVLGL